jgi:hypothetical protein
MQTFLGIFSYQFFHTLITWGNIILECGFLSTKNKMSKQGKTRTMSLCLSDIPKDKILKHSNGKLYLPLQTYDYDTPDKYDNDFSVSISLTKEEIEAKKNGATVNRVFLGNGRIWEDKGMQKATEEEADDLPF